MAGCGCGQTALNRRVARMQAEQPGGLGNYVNCSVLYPADGPYTDSILVVGRFTIGERLFLREDFAAATDYANEIRSGIENVPSSTLCLEAVEDLLAV